MKNQKSKLKIYSYKILILSLGLVLILSLSGSLFLIQKIKSDKNSLSPSTPFVKPASAQEIYPLFLCPCCGKTIDALCCEMAKERKTFVDGLVAGKLPKDEVMMAYVRKYGLDSFKDLKQKEEFKGKLAQIAPTERPVIKINPVTFDWGEVSQKEGVVTTFFELKNVGTEDLIIDKLETSCGCTSASIVYQEKEGPKFAMPGHSINEKIENWQVTIAPSKTAQLKVYYDPNVHQDFRGPAIREIYVFSNDPIDFEKKVRIELNQIN